MKTTSLLLLSLLTFAAGAETQTFNCRGKTFQARFKLTNGRVSGSAFAKYGLRNSGVLVTLWGENEDLSEEVPERESKSITFRRAELGTVGIIEATGEICVQDCTSEEVKCQSKVTD